MRMRGPGGRSSACTDRVMRHGVLLATGEKEKNTQRQTFVKYSRLEQTCLQTSEAQRQRDRWIERLGEEKTLTSPSVIGSIVLLSQIAIMMPSLCQESGRQKAGNGWESRKGSGEACGGEHWEKGCLYACVCVSEGVCLRVCVTRTEEGEEGE